VFAWLMAACLGLAGCSAPLTPAAAPPTTGASLPAPEPTLPAAAPPTATAVPDCRAQLGVVESVSYPSPILQKDIPVRVFVPACHGLLDENYPVLYLLHGYPYNETQWGTLGLDLVVAGAVLSGEWPPFLVVMPRVPDPLFRSTDGGRGSYEEELVEGLVSYIDLAYRTDPRPEGRALAGISRGGVWSLEIGLGNPDVFQSVGAVSPALSVNSARPEYDPTFIVRRGEPLPERIYLLAGEDDWAREATQDLSQLLDGLGIAHEYAVYPGGHDDASWAPALKPMIDYLIAGWPR
jgi:enterochelin esterase-like enzyme